MKDTYVSAVNSELRIKKNLISEKSAIVGTLIRKEIENNFDLTLAYENVNDILKLFTRQVGTIVELPKGIIAVSERV